MTPITSEDSFLAKITIKLFSVALIQVLGLKSTWCQKIRNTYTHTQTKYSNCCCICALTVNQNKKQL